MVDYVGWVASAATMIAAMMTAANLGTRVTGWGFVVFTVGSIAWTTVGALSGQNSLMITNAFLFVVNLFGVWRWLGRQARYEQGSAAAAERSQRDRHVPTLFSGGGLIGSKVEDRNGETVGTIVDTMFACDTRTLSYVVIGQGGVVGAGEKLRALGPQHLVIGKDGVRTKLEMAEVSRMAPLDEDAWPIVAPEPVRG